MRVLAVIPARHGSARIPHKNLELVGQESLVERALYALQGCRTVPSPFAVVSTDCVGVAIHLLQDGDECNVIERRCGADGPTVDVLLDALAIVDEWGWPGGAFDTVACIQPTSPFRRPEDIDGCIALLDANPEARSVVSVNEETGLRNGAVFLTRVEMLKEGLVHDADSLRYPMPALRSIDINEPSDLELARKIAKEHGW